MQQHDINLLLQRLDDLESKQAFQEVTIEDLNQIIIQHQSEFTKLRELLSLLSKRIHSGSPVAPLSEETAPPHY